MGRDFLALVAEKILAIQEKVIQIGRLSIDLFSINSFISFIANKDSLRYYASLLKGIRRLWLMQYDGMWSPFCRVSRT
jgi:hypothetical protein